MDFCSFYALYIMESNNNALKLQGKINENK